MPPIPLIPRVRLDMIMVPLRQCVVVQLGALDENVVQRLEQQGFDDAPVMQGDQAVGITSTVELRRHLLHNIPITLNDCQPLSRVSLTVASDCTVGADILLQRLASNRSLLITQGVSEGQHEALGLVTVSDLNRHAMRSSLYDALALLESEIARLVQHRYGDVWEWIRHLNEDAQVHVLGYWELTRRRDLDVGPIAATTLTQLLQVLARDKELLLALGFKSKSKFDKVSGGIPGLRNSVMHPVRPLVLGPEEVADVLATLVVTVDLTKRVASLDSLDSA